MFNYISGIVDSIEPGIAVIDCSGIGYQLFTTAHTQSQLNIGKKGKLYAYEVIREDCFDLYGFTSMSEKRCFEMLIGVSGVGPKAAISILSATTPESLAVAIVTENEKAITAAAGVGKKLAQRVILELKDKMARLSGSTDSSSVILPDLALASPGGALSDATAALAVLGYSSSEISSALKGIDAEELSTEEIIKICLKQMLK